MQQKNEAPQSAVGTKGFSLSEILWIKEHPHESQDPFNIVVDSDLNRSFDHDHCASMFSLSIT